MAIPGNVRIQILLSILSIKTVLAHYCEFDSCQLEEYCCGDNKCCSKTLDTWFFWAGIFLVILAVAVAAGLRYSYYIGSTNIIIANSRQADFVPTRTQSDTTVLLA